MGTSQDAADGAADSLVTCSLQGGTLSVYEDRVVIERSGASIHEDKTVPMDEVRGVAYSSGWLTGHIQIEQVGVEPDKLIDGLAPHATDSEYGIRGVHIYTMNQVPDTEDWRRGRLE